MVMNLWASSCIPRRPWQVNRQSGGEGKVEGDGRWPAVEGRKGALRKGNPVVPADQDDGGGAGAVLPAADEDGGEPSFPLEPDAGVGKELVRRLRAVGKEGEKVAGPERPPGGGDPAKPLLPPDYLGPRGVGEMVGDAVNPRGKPCRQLGTVGKDGESVRRAEEEGEAVVVSPLPFEALPKGFHIHVALQEVAHEPATGELCRGVTAGLAEVGERREAPRGRHSQPGAAPLEVPAGKDLGRLRPEGSRRGRPGMVLVAVGGDDQPVEGMAVMCNEDQAHA